jgi:6-phosphogluconate dehydrogenase
MQLGMVGLGRMGASLARRAMIAGHECVVYDVDQEAVAGLEADGASGASSIEELASKLSPSRAVWVMVPAGLAGTVVAEVAKVLHPGDIVIDGGNTLYHDDIDRAEALGESEIRYLDVGTSGGVFGLERGFSLMIGGDEGTVSHLEPIFQALAPGVAAAGRTPGHVGDPTPAERGYLHCGPVGAGHFVKMVHNGIEYGMMAAYAEGLNILAHADVGMSSRDVDAETAPLRDRRLYRFDIDIPEVVEVWRRGSVVSSWLLDLTAAALVEDPNLDDFSGRVSDSGEARWTVQAAIDMGVPAPVLSAALYQRFSSRDAADYADRVLSAMRRQFGGHHEKQGD